MAATDHDVELEIPQDLIDAIREQAENEAPNEACGYLTGTDGVARVAVPMINIDHSPEHFSLDPAEQFAAVKDARERNHVILAVYHSHPETPARMSDEDIRLANDTAVIYVIYSLATDETRGFRVIRDQSESDDEQKKRVEETKVRIL